MIGIRGVPHLIDRVAMAKGIDLQLERAITEMKTLIKAKGFTAPKIPAYGVR